MQEFVYLNTYTKKYKSLSAKLVNLKYFFFLLFYYKKFVCKRHLAFFSPCTNIHAHFFYLFFKKKAYWLV